MKKIEKKLSLNLKTMFKTLIEKLKNQILKKNKCKSNWTRFTIMFQRLLNFSNQSSFYWLLQKWTTI